jgi:23S rRNA (guanine745-N1)-methyltransferase
MNISPFEDLVCPLDGGRLVADGATWRCESGHSFDVARQGYTHLLPVQQKRSREPGDSKEMVAARRRFLEAGYYRPIAAAVGEWVLAARGERVACLDAGCGEGYYLRELAALATSNRRSATLALLGLDISKWAVLAAARQDPRPRWVVGSNARLPVHSGSVDCVLCIFGFPVYPEFERVLRPGGRLLLVDPGPEHLRELREIIYPTLKAPAGEERSFGPFSRRSSQALTYTIELSTPAQIGDLLAMTPHLHRAGAQGRAAAAALTALSVTVDVRLSSLRLQSP